MKVLIKLLVSFLFIYSLAFANEVADAAVASKANIETTLKKHDKIHTMQKRNSNQIEFHVELNLCFFCH